MNKKLDKRSLSTPLGDGGSDGDEAVAKPDFSKYPDGLVPTIIQDYVSNKVLMLGFMNETALSKTEKEGKVIFFSRSKQGLWKKGETSGNFLLVREILLDCDRDTLLIKATPTGLVCHSGADTCFNEDNHQFSLQLLEQIISDRKNNPTDTSYTSSLFAAGISKIAQKVGEEAVELIIEAKGDDDNLFINEAADLLYHMLVLLSARKKSLNDVVNILSGRNHIEK